LVTESLVGLGKVPERFRSGRKAEVNVLTSLADRPGRAAVAVGAMVVVSTTTAVALASGAAAAEPGRCTGNVDVRSEPDVTSRVVTLCEAGTPVRVGETRDGFVQLVDLEGWAAQEYVAVDEAAPHEAGPEDADSGGDTDLGCGAGAGSSGR
jgi:hypothetical protein